MTPVQLYRLRYKTSWSVAGFRRILDRRLRPEHAGQHVCASYATATPQTDLEEQKKMGWATMQAQGTQRSLA